MNQWTIWKYCFHWGAAFFLIKPSCKDKLRAKSYCAGKAGGCFFHLSRQDSFWTSVEATELGLAILWKQYFVLVGARMKKLGPPISDGCLGSVEEERISLTVPQTLHNIFAEVTGRWGHLLIWQKRLSSSGLVLLVWWFLFVCLFGGLVCYTNVLPFDAVESSHQRTNIQDNIIIVYVLATVPLRKRCSQSHWRRNLKWCVSSESLFSWRVISGIRQRDH